ncbi:MAG: protein kinase, partial [Candidatus Neomarinimicrobiota bacterium]
LAKCDSPYIVKLGSIEPRPLEIQSNSYVLYSEEFLPGDSLQQLLGSGHRPAKEEILELLACMLGAVQNLMQFRVIHRDIKPGNIIKTTLSDRPFVLLDLGLAFAVGGSRITRDSQKIPGTLYYIAPEMLEMNFRQNLDFRADLYTIGLTIYEYASGINPYARRQEDQFTTLYRIKNYKPKPLNQLRTDLPTDMCNLIDQLMRKIPALRPANIDQLLKRQEAF